MGSQSGQLVCQAHPGERKSELRCVLRRRPGSIAVDRVQTPMNLPQKRANHFLVPAGTQNLSIQSAEKDDQLTQYPPTHGRFLPSTACLAWARRKEQSTPTADCASVSVAADVTIERSEIVPSIPSAPRGWDQSYRCHFDR